MLRHSMMWVMNVCAVMDLPAPCVVLWERHVTQATVLVTVYVPTLNPDLCVHVDSDIWEINVKQVLVTSKAVATEIFNTNILV